MKSLVILFLFAASLTAHASAQGDGPGAGGGGLDFVCGSSNQAYLADTYAHFSELSDEARLTIRKVSTESALQGILASVRTIDSKLGDTLLENLKTLQFRPGGPIPLLGDDDITTIPAGCQKAQMAVQHLKTGIVDYDTKLYRSLTSVERALFRLHEAYVRVFARNSIDVRSRVAQLAWSDLYQKLIAQDERQPRLASCGPLMAIPFVNLACDHYVSSLPGTSLYRKQITAYYCENAPETAAFDDRQLDLCAAVIGSLDSFGYQRVVMTTDPALIPFWMKPGRLFVQPDQFEFWSGVNDVMTARGYRRKPLSFLNNPVCTTLDGKLWNRDQSFLGEMTSLDTCYEKDLYGKSGGQPSSPAGLVARTTLPSTGNHCAKIPTAHLGKSTKGFSNNVINAIVDEIRTRSLTYKAYTVMGRAPYRFDSRAKVCDFIDQVSARLAAHGWILDPSFIDADKAQTDDMIDLGVDVMNAMLKGAK